MDNIMSKIEPALQKKGITIKKMCQDIGISEQSYHRAKRENSMTMKNYRKIKDYLNIEDETKDFVSSTNINTIDYWKGLINQLSGQITELQIENWTLKKELGKFKPVLFLPNSVSL